MPEQYVTKDTPIGIRVRYVDAHAGNKDITGKEGTIIYNDGDICRVEFDEPFAAGHSDFHRGRGKRYWVFPEGHHCLVVVMPIPDEAIDALLLGGEQ